MSTLGGLPRAAARAPIHAYQWTLRPLLGLDCRFVPRCSDYALEAISAHGAAKGTLLAAARVLRCNPWCAGGHDPVPPPALPANPITR